MKSSTATKIELREEIRQLRHVGAQMANLCFNLSQKSEVSPTNREIMSQLRVQWDEIRRTEPAK